MIRCVLVLTTLLVATGCSYHIAGRGIVHPQSSVTSPTFCIYSESSRDEGPKRSQKSEPLAIKRLEVYLTHEKSGRKEDAWVIYYQPDSLYEELKPFSCITYGKLPPGYREKAPALPLIPECHYYTRLRSIHGGFGGYVAIIEFYIRLDSDGQPTKLEYADHYPWTYKTLGD